MASPIGRGRGMGRSRGGGRVQGRGRGQDNGEIVHSTQSSDAGNDVVPESTPNEVVNASTIETGGEASNSRTLELDPNSLWFHKNSVTREITNSIQSYYNDPWRNWSEVDKDTKDQWFRSFKRKFTWRPELEELVRKNFDQKGGKRLKDLHHWLTSTKPRKKGRVCPEWMSLDVHERLLKRLDDPEFKQRSEIAKKNKLAGSLNGVVHPGHCQGSVSTHEYTERIAIEEGSLPLAADVYERLHSTGDAKEGKKPCTTEVSKIMDAYQKKIVEYKEKNIDKDPNEVYFEVVGGRKKGLVPGLGSGGDIWYKKSTNRAKGLATTYTPSLLSQLSSQVQQSQQQLNEKMVEFERQRVEFEQERVNFEKQRIELEQERVKIQKELSDERKHVFAALEVMKNQMVEKNQQQKQCKTLRLPQSNDRQDPSSGGAPYAT